MYINSQVLNYQFKLNYIYISDLSPSRLSNSDRENNLENFIFIYSNSSISHPYPEQTVYAAGGETQLSCPYPLSRPAALDISHQSHPNRGGAC
jgi:hypothetical protein